MQLDLRHIQWTGVDMGWQVDGEPASVLWLAGHIQLTSIDDGRSWWWCERPTLIVPAHLHPISHSPRGITGSTSVASDESDISGRLIKPERHNQIPGKFPRTQFPVSQAEIPRQLFQGQPCGDLWAKAKWHMQTGLPDCRFSAISYLYSSFGFRFRLAATTRLSALIKLVYNGLD